MSIQTFYNQLFKTKINIQCTTISDFKKPPSKKETKNPKKLLHLRWHFNMKVSYVFADVVSDVKAHLAKLLWVIV